MLVANKLDAVRRRTDLLPWLKQMQERHAFAEYVPMSATKRRRRASACSASCSRTCPSSPGCTRKTR